MFVNLNIVSATASHQAMTGRPFSPIIPSAMAKRMLKTTICSTSPFRHRADHRFRDDVQQDLIPRLRLGGDLGLLPHRQVDADPRPHHVHRDQADHERERRDDLEVDDGAQAHAADDLHVAGAGDAGDQRREDQRRDDHLDQAQEELAEGPEVGGRRGVVLADDPADDDADRQADENLLGERQAAAPCPIREDEDACQSCPCRRLNGAGSGRT